MPEPGEQPKQNPQREFVYTIAPNGDPIGLFERMRQERSREEIRMNSALLKPGDLIAMQYSKEDGTICGFTYKVEETEWYDLGIAGGFGPSKTLRGELQGTDLPKEIQSKKALFAGSGFGGSIMDPDIIITGRSPYFSLEKGEFRAPILTNFKVLRKDENNELRVVEREQIDAEARKKNDKHNQRLIQIEELMMKFGFDKNKIYNFSNTSNTLIYQDERYQAQFDRQMAMGNKLTVS